MCDIFWILTYLWELFRILVLVWLNFGHVECKSMVHTYRESNIVTHWRWGWVDTRYCRKSCTCWYSKCDWSKVHDVDLIRMTKTYSQGESARFFKFCNTSSAFSMRFTQSLQNEMRCLGDGSRNFSTYRGDEWFIEGLVGKPEGKNLPGRPRRKWENNIKVHLQEEWWGHGLEWSGSGQGQVGVLINAVMKLRLAQIAGKFLTGWGQIRFSRRTLPHGFR